MSELDFQEVNAMLKEVVPYISPTKQDVVIFLRAVAEPFHSVLYQAGEAVGRRAHNEVPHLRGHPAARIYCVGRLSWYTHNTR